MDARSPTLVTESAGTQVGPMDMLTDLEVKIARRADEIAATVPRMPGANLFCWLKAEHEILARAEFMDRPMTKVG